MLNVHLIEALVGLLYTESRDWAKTVKGSLSVSIGFNLLSDSLPQEWGTAGELAECSVLWESSPFYFVVLSFCWLPKT